MSFGTTEPQQVQVRQSLKNLKRRFELYKPLNDRFPRLTVTRTRSNEEEEYSEEDAEEDEPTPTPYTIKFYIFNMKNNDLIFTSNPI